MIEWIDAIIPGEREIAKLAMVRGQRFAAIGEWQEPRAASTRRRSAGLSRPKWVVVLASQRDRPSVFETLDDAKRFVEATAKMI